MARKSKRLKKPRKGGGVALNPLHVANHRDLTIKYLEKSREEQLAECYGLLHKDYGGKGRFSGKSWQQRDNLLVRKFSELIPNVQKIKILDFGCGKTGGISEIMPDSVTPFDPYVEEYSEDPWGKEFDCIFSVDVLEHLTKNQLFDLFRKIEESQPQYVFFQVGCQPARHVLADGTNAHEIVEPPSWWKSEISERMPSYELKFSEDRTKEIQSGNSDALIKVTSGTTLFLQRKK